MSSKVDVSRRNFLRVSGLGSAGLAVAALLPGATQSEPVEVVEKPQGDGYRLTSHIRKYYETARL